MADGEIVGRPRAELDGVAARPRQALLALDAQIGRGDRRDGETDDDRRGRQVQRVRRQPIGMAEHLDDRHDRHRHREEEQEVAVRQALDHERGGEAGQREPRAGREVAVQRPQRDRHPAVHQHLQVRHVGCAVRAPHERQRGEHRGVPASGEIARQQIHAGASQRERADQRDVVDEDGVAGQPVDWRQRHARCRAGVRSRRACRYGIERRRRPQAAQHMPQPIGVPAEDPRVQQRIAERRRHRRAGPQRQGPGPGDGERENADEDGGPLAGGGAEPGTGTGPCGGPVAFIWRDRACEPNCACVLAARVRGAEVGLGQARGGEASGELERASRPTAPGSGRARRRPRRYSRRPSASRASASAT